MRSSRTEAESDGVPKNQIRIGVDYKKRCIISKWKWYGISQKQEIPRLSVKKNILLIRSYARLKKEKNSRSDFTHSK